MKKILLSVIIFMAAKALQAQDDYYNDAATGFRKERVFVGGSVALGFGSGSFAVGANPEIGYTVAQWLDAGVVFNINYRSQRVYAFNGSGYIYQGKASSFNYGGGIFARAYPLPFLFLQLQPEVNWISYSQKDVYGNQTKLTVNAASFIGGIGYGQRIIGQGSYFFMIGLDLINDLNSPYNDGYGRAVPIIRGGFDVYLRPSRKTKPVGNQL